MRDAPSAPDGVRPPEHTSWNAEELAAMLAPLVAEHLAELLQPTAPAAEPELLTAAQLAARMGVHRSWIYAHAEELGAVHLGATGKDRRPRLRFPADAGARCGSERSDVADPAPQRGSRSRRVSRPGSSAATSAATGRVLTSRPRGGARATER